MTLYDYEDYDGEYFGGSVLDFISEFKITEKDGEIVLVKYNGSDSFVAIPNGITVIGINAFKDTDLTTVILPESVKRIEDCAFSNCGEIESFDFPENIQTIGYEIFENTIVHDINIPDSIIDCSDSFVLKRLTTNKNYQCANNIYFNNLKHAIVHGNIAIKTSTFKLPTDIKAIGAGVFSSIDRLMEVELPETLEYIGKSAFRNCENLRTINFPENLKYIGESAFFATSLSEIDLGLCEDLNVIPNFCFTNNKVVEKVFLPSFITRIGEDAFFGCEKLYYANFEDCSNLKIIDKTAFDGCDFRNLNFPKDPLFAICNSAFKSNENLTKLQLPSSLRYMASNAFAYTGLDRVVVPRKTKVSEEVGATNDKKIYVED